MQNDEAVKKDLETVDESKYPVELPIDTTDEKRLVVKDEPKRVIVVLGMHRSGTSAVTRALSALGVDLGNNLMSAGLENEKGYWEDLDLNEINIELLESLGQNWHSLSIIPPSRFSEAKLDSLSQRAVEALRRKVEKTPIYGFKDPRTAKVLPFWKDAFGKLGLNASYLIALRHPRSVAESLKKRDRFEVEKSYYLWLEHLILSITETEGAHRAIVDYDSLLSDPRAQLERISRDLDLSRGIGPALELEREYCDNFLDKALRHACFNLTDLSEDPAVPADVTQTFELLQKVASDEIELDSPDVKEQVDLVANNLLNCAPLLSYLDKCDLGVSRNNALLVQIENALAESQKKESYYKEIEEENFESLRSALHALGGFSARTGQIQDQNITVEHQNQTVPAPKYSRDQYLEDLRRVLQNKELEIDDVNAMLRQKESENLSIMGQMDALKREAHEREAVISGLGQALSETRERSEAFRREIFSSTSWRLTSPVRSLGTTLIQRRLSFLPSSSLVAKVPRLLSRSKMIWSKTKPTTGLAPNINSIDRVLFISGEPDTPGHLYRVVRQVESLCSIGVNASFINVEDIPSSSEAIAAATVILVWRAPWSENLAKVFSKARSNHAIIGFDVDDYMIDPNLANPETIDAIRSEGFDRVAVAEHFSLVRKTAGAADFCTCTTEALAAGLRGLGKPVFISPNGFDGSTYAISRRAALAKANSGNDGLIRIGYAAGTRTHQRDFSTAKKAVAKVLGEFPECRLVLFRSRDKKGATLNVDEYSELRGLAAQIEYRDFVPLTDLPNEISRFDINIVPLEINNMFCEAKSELKFWEAALVCVPTIASTTQPFRSAIQHGENGLLAKSEEEWYSGLRLLVTNKLERDRIARNAYLDVLWQFGPEQRAIVGANVLAQVAGRPWETSALFSLDLLRQRFQHRSRPYIPEHRVIFESVNKSYADVAVTIPLYNYENYVLEALESISKQTLPEIELIVVDDCSTDLSQALVLEWLRKFQGRFARAVLIQNVENAGLGPTRNVGFFNANARFVMPVDADNLLLPKCLQTCVERLEQTGAAMAFPMIRCFGDGEHLMGTMPWYPGYFIEGNIIDAMAMVRRSAWAKVGGYSQVRTGWEDYGFWCTFVEHGLWGVQVAEELAMYRVHQASMLRTDTEVAEKKRKVLDHFRAQHPWLRVKDPRIDNVPMSNFNMNSNPSNPRVRGRQRITQLLEIMRCPVSAERLHLESEHKLINESGTQSWVIKDGRPILFPGMPVEEVKAFEHLSNPIPEKGIDLIKATSGLVLNLSGGGTSQWFENVVEAEAGIFRNTDLIADAHVLPFADESFALIISMNSFEHYRNPNKVVSELKRVLQPGGKIFLHTAFLQPLHEAPWHFYNCTKYGLLEWFDEFTLLNIQVSENFNPAFSLAWLVSEIETLLRTERSASAAERFMSTPISSFVQYWRNPASRDGGMWNEFIKLPKEAQERVAAGFELLVQKDLN